MKSIILTFSILIFTNYIGYSQYNSTWKNHFEKQGIQLVDSLIILPSNVDTLIIPTPLSSKKLYTFSIANSKKNGIINLTRTNYTDIEFDLKINEFKLNGVGTLSPWILQGTESVSYNRDEYWIHEYYLPEESSECL